MDEIELFDFLFGSDEHKEDPNEIIKRKIIGEIHNAIQCVFENISIRFYSKQISKDLKNKMQELAYEFKQTRSNAEINQDLQLFGHNNNLYKYLFDCEFESIEYEKLKNEKHSENKRIFIMDKVANFYTDSILKKIQRNRWPNIAKYHVPQNAAVKYFNFRTKKEVNIDYELELNLNDYIDTFEKTFSNIKEERKNGSKSALYKKYKNYVVNVIYKKFDDKDDAYCSDEEVIEMAHFYYYNRTNEEINEDDKALVTMSDYIGWCEQVWEDIEKRRQQIEENEQFRIEQEYYESSQNFNRTDKYSQHGGPSDGYGDYLNDDYINDVLGGEPDAHWNLD